MTVFVCGSFSASNASAFTDTLKIIVVGEDPLINMQAISDQFTQSGSQIVIEYQYQHAEAIDFELINNDGTVFVPRHVEPDRNTIAGIDRITFSLSDLPDGNYSVAAKVTGSLGEAENTLPFSYAAPAVILASATIPTEIISALEKNSSSAGSPTNGFGITSADRLVTSIILGLIVASGSFLAFRKLGLVKRRQLVSDSAITFM